MSSRMKDQLDFDLDRFIDMFDHALTSDDERVVNALRSLMMIVVLTKPEVQQSTWDIGPLRRLFEDQTHILRRLERIEMEIKRDHARTYDSSKVYYERMREDINKEWSKFHSDTWKIPTTLLQGEVLTSTIQQPAINKGNKNGK